MPGLSPRPCEVCQQAYQPRTSWQKTCSEACRRAKNKANEPGYRRHKRDKQRADATRLPAGARLTYGRSDLAAQSDGTIWSADPSKSGRWVRLKPYALNGRIVVKISRGGQARTYSVAALVLSAWAEPRPMGHVPLRWPDPDPWNNRLENLRWATRGDVRIARGLGGRLPHPGHGSDHHGAALSAEAAREVVRLYRTGEFALAEIAERFGVAETTIHSIVHGRSYVNDTTVP